MALRKMDLFSVDTLSDGTEETLIKVQDVLRYAGYNWWSDGAAEIMQIAWNIKNKYNYELPPEPEAWLQYRGVSRKILMLILQDGFYHHPDQGIVCDRHVTNVMLRLGFTSVDPKDKQREVKIAEQIEQHLHRDKYKLLNEACACPRQLYANINNHAWMEDVAKQVGCYNTFMKVVKGVKSGRQSSRFPVDQVNEEVLEAARKDFLQETFLEVPDESTAALIAAALETVLDDKGEYENEGEKEKEEKDVTKEGEKDVVMEDVVMEDVENVPLVVKEEEIFKVEKGII